MKLVIAVVFPALLIVCASGVYAAEDDAPQPSWAEVLPDLEGDVAAGREKAESCDVCHGDYGFSEHRYYPVLAGQIEKYLVFQLHRLANR